MKLRKVLAAIAASAVAVSAMAVASSAYTATLGFADGVWAAQDWATAVEVTGDGTYTLKAKCEMTTPDEETGEDVTYAVDGTGIMVFVIDIAELGAELGLNEAPEGAVEGDESWKYATGDVKVTNVKVVTGSTEIAVDQANVKVGDIESKGNLRIELYNEYGPTKEAPAVDPTTFAFLADDQFEVTFTIEGLDTVGGEDAGDGEGEDTGAGDVGGETDGGKDSPDTGIEDVAVVAGLAIVAAGAVVLSKKRK